MTQRSSGAWRATLVASRIVVGAGALVIALSTSLWSQRVMRGVDVGGTAPGSVAPGAAGETDNSCSSVVST